MTPRTWRQVKQVYAAASELSGNARLAYLESISRENPALATEALRLLRLDEGAEEHLAPLRVPSGFLTTALGQRVFHDGESLLNRYLIRRYLASGGMGQVYEAEDLEREERIAIKAIRPELAQDTYLGWLQREIDLARRINHPNVCRVFDLVRLPNRPFLTMEFLEGNTLADYLRRYGTLSERQALPLLRQVIAGLHAAHSAGVIHRDLKPSNIMIVPRPEGAPRAVIMDFGLARQAPPDQNSALSHTWSIGIGTPAYMAPEQIEGRKSTAASDIYSFGVVLFEMLTGHLPFSSDSPLSLAVRKTREAPPSPLAFAPNLRPSWVHVLRRCLQPKPSARFPSITHVLPALESRSRLRLLSRFLQRTLRRTRVLVTAAAMLLLLAFFLWPILPLPVTPAALALWDQGIQSLHAGSPAAALGFFEQALAAGRTPPRIHADIALAWHALGFPQPAAAALRRAPRWFHPDQDYLRAVALFLQGNHEHALAALPELPDSPTRLADLAHLASGPPSRWRRVAFLRPNYAPAHFHIADAAALEGRWREADGAFQAAQLYFHAAHNPALARAVAARRGLRRLTAGDTQLALADLSAAPNDTPGIGPCEHVTVLMAGVPDNFSSTADALPYLSPNFRPKFPKLFQAPRPGFDEPRDNQEFLFSIPLPPVRICSGKIEFRIRRGIEPAGADNDEILLGAAPLTNDFLPPHRFPLWAGTNGAGERVASFDLPPEFFANIQRAYAGRDPASLDVLAGDDTIFDYCKLTIFY